MCYVMYVLLILYLSEHHCQPGLQYEGTWYEMSMKSIARNLCTHNTGNVKIPIWSKMTHKGDSAYQPSRWVISFGLLPGFVSLSLPLLLLLLAEDSDLPVALVVMETCVPSKSAVEKIIHPIHGH